MEVAARLSVILVQVLIMRAFESSILTVPGLNAVCLDNGHPNNI